MIVPMHVKFVLPRGLMDASGVLHREGVMRLATATDEIEPLEDERVRRNAGWLSVLVLSRVVVRLGTLEPIAPDVIGHLFSEDFAYLQELFMRINHVGRATTVETRCPTCESKLELDLSELQL